MRRTHLRGHTNILKRLLIHAGGFNLGLVMRHLIGIGTPRGLQGALLHESELARTDPGPQFLHRPMRCDIGLPSPVI